MKRKLLVIIISVVACSVFISTQGFILPQDKPDPVPAGTPWPYVSTINIDLDEADHLDYAHVVYHGTTTDCGSTDGWVDLGNFYFNDYGYIAIELGCPFGYIEATVTVYIDGYPNCPYTITNHVGYSCLNELRNLCLDFNPVYPWACPIPQEDPPVEEPPL